MSEANNIITGRISPIGLDELNARSALQTRVDSKYVLRLDDLDRLVHLIGADLQVLHIDDRQEQTYDTVYFDSNDLGCFHDHLQRRRYGYKLRTRTYIGSGLQVFEVKMRDGRGNTVKVKTDHSGTPPTVIGTSAANFYHQAISNHYGFHPTRTFKPSLRNRYDRIALAARHAQERTTIDHTLQFIDPATNQTVGGLHEHLVLIETKSATGSGTIDRALWRLGIRPSRISKYCIGIGMLFPNHQPNRYHRAATTAFIGTRTRPVVQLTPGRSVPAPPISAEELPRPPRPPRPLREIRPPRPPRVG